MRLTKIKFGYTVVKKKPSTLPPGKIFVPFIGSRKGVVDRIDDNRPPGLRGA